MVDGEHTFFVHESPLLLLQYTHQVTCFIFMSPVDTKLQFFIDDGRLNRSRTENFYLLNFISLFEQYPTVSIIGASGNLYSITFSPTTVRCSCPDHFSPCKHILFVLSILRLEPQVGPFTLNLTQCISFIKCSTPFLSHRVNLVANQMCFSFLSKRCAICSRPRAPSDGCLYICDNCHHLLHSGHVHQPGQPLPPRCPLCQHTWSPYISGTSGGYHNFSSLLHTFGYESCPPNNPRPPRLTANPNSYQCHVIPLAPYDHTSDRQA